MPISNSTKGRPREAGHPERTHTSKGLRRLPGQTETGKAASRPHASRRCKGHRAAAVLRLQMRVRRAQSGLCGATGARPFVRRDLCFLRMRPWVLGQTRVQKRRHLGVPTAAHTSFPCLFVSGQVLLIDRLGELLLESIVTGSVRPQFPDGS